MNERSELISFVLCPPLTRCFIIGGTRCAGILSVHSYGRAFLCDLRVSSEAGGENGFMEEDLK
ncbi:MAG: hypothetical protein JRJ85_27215 [Deltaproteobacteria bacterium]|nr:hypothetical protein [Deltaproteobacteria bacterium]